jgi:hypothetical protein
VLRILRANEYLAALIYDTGSCVASPQGKRMRPEQDVHLYPQNSTFGLVSHASMNFKL